MKKRLPRINKEPEYKDDYFHVRFNNFVERFGSFVCSDDNNTWYYVDVFVGCAWPYERREELLGRSAMVRGFWSSFDSKVGRQTFIVEAGGIALDSL